MHPLRRPVALLAATVAALAVAIPSTASAHSRVKEFPLAEFALPADITAGPDGALWAPDSSLGRLWRVTTKGKVSSMPLGSGPIAVANGRDGALWVADREDMIHRVTTGGQVTSYPLPTPGSFPASIVAGPDGALWFTESGGNKVGRITTSGELTEFPLETPDSLPGPIVTGRDGALYFAERNTNVITRMTAAGKVTRRFPLPTADANPVSLLPTRHGLLISEQATGLLRPINLGGWFSWPLRTKSSPGATTLGPDGNLWYASGSESTIGRVRLGRR